MTFIEDGPVPEVEDGVFRWRQPLARVKPEWVDGYRHLNMGYYLVAYDAQTDRLWPHLGLGTALRESGLGTFAAEAWLDYQREMTEGMPIGAESEVLAVDEKRLLVRHRMFHWEEGWTASAHEVLYLCVDLERRRVTPWPEALRQRLASTATGAPPQRLALSRRRG
ncbi:acyl-CoA thioesterase [Sabulicella glaciei]|uniref:Thioesterase family protein n=1 Tax=Sabulicella glaciei TaxID=2984948 RepID=A0ABT3NR67_9PROT|nr:thioesterase family protein [Roseococcus sp. MDT2-1-1]MCW8084655.1 thioesterase family protein [Roseococcus sp. MDT2-1-1]